MTEKPSNAHTDRGSCTKTLLGLPKKQRTKRRSSRTNCKGSTMEATHKTLTSGCKSSHHDQADKTAKTSKRRGTHDPWRGNASFNLECNGIHHHPDRTSGNHKQRKPMDKSYRQKPNLQTSKQTDSSLHLTYHNTSSTTAAKRATRSNTVGLDQAESQSLRTRL